MPDAITGAAPAATAFTTSTTPTAPPQRNDQLGRDAFMQLLVAQLRFQDPLSPTTRRTSSHRPRSSTPSRSSRS